MGQQDYYIFLHATETLEKDSDDSLKIAVFFHKR